MDAHAIAARQTGGLNWPRLALALPLAWWTFSLGTGKSTWCFVDYVNLPFHEAGHLVLSFAGTTLHYLGGTLGQLAVPGLLALYFLLKHGQPFAAAVCTWWVGENLINIAVYMADARSQSLPLVGGGGHDWNELLFRFGMLTKDGVDRASGVTRGAGVILMLLGLAWCVYFVLPGHIRERIGSAAVSRWPWLRAALET